MRRTIKSSFVQIIGKLWMPGVTAATSTTVTDHDLDSLRDDAGNITRESVEQWLTTHSGDSSQGDDFRADIEDGEKNVIIDWADPESELVYSDCMFPCFD